MEIIDNRSCDETVISKLQPGDCFEYKKEIFMLISENTNGIETYHFRVNDITYFEKQITVKPIKVKLIIEEDDN